MEEKTLYKNIFKRIAVPDVIINPQSCVKLYIKARVIAWLLTTVRFVNLYAETESLMMSICTHAAWWPLSRIQDLDFCACKKTLNKNIFKRITVPEVYLAPILFWLEGTDCTCKVLLRNEGKFLSQF